VAKKFNAEPKIKILFRHVSCTSLEYPETDRVVSEFSVQTMEIQYLKFPSKGPAKSALWEPVFSCGSVVSETQAENLFLELRSVPEGTALPTIQELLGQDLVAKMALWGSLEKEPDQQLESDVLMLGPGRPSKVGISRYASVLRAQVAPMRILADPPLAVAFRDYVGRHLDFYLSLLAAVSKEGFTFGDEKAVVDRLVAQKVTLANLSVMVQCRDVRVLIPFALNDPADSPFRRSHEKVLRNNKDLPMWVIDIKNTTVETFLAFKNQVSVLNSSRMSRWFHNLYDHYNFQFQNVQLSVTSASHVYDTLPGEPYIKAVLSDPFDVHTIMHDGKTSSMSKRVALFFLFHRYPRPSPPPPF